MSVTVKIKLITWKTSNMDGGDENAHTKLRSENLNGKRSLERLRLRWKINIKTYLKETRCENMDCTRLLQDRV
jgi:hypothetical protein